MTKHRKKEEWIDEILNAAAARIVEEGYPNLTMEAIAARTTLSKGGVYRYFSNKRDVALALFQRVYMNSVDFDIDEIVALNLSIENTIRHLLESHREAAQLQQDHSIWVQLIPETLWDEGFREERKRLFSMLEAKYASLFRRIAERDGLVIGPDVEPAFERYVYL
ncbi:MAG: TetR/AcrR family transcriptional regulator, partial [Myxococcota bacterium]